MDIRAILIFLVVGAYVQQGVSCGKHNLITFKDVSLMSPNKVNYTVSTGEPIAATMRLMSSQPVSVDDYINVVLYREKDSKMAMKHEVNSDSGFSGRCLANKFCLDVHIIGLEIVTTAIIGDVRIKDGGQYIVKVTTKKKDEATFLDQGAGRFAVQVIQGENTTERCVCRRKNMKRRKNRGPRAKHHCGEGSSICP
ncbi:uncharacterized protein [Ptychodera flava]|uniref:uncharacterized protein n=1 Tax=Ptychodera flava TaxID=63121 RepID=UPI00396AB14D